MEWPAPGKYRFKPASEVKINTFKDASLASAMAHDLEMMAPKIDGEVVVGKEETKVSLRVPLWDLELVKGQLSRLEQMEWRRTLRKKILKDKKASADFAGKMASGGNMASGRLSLFGPKSKEIEIPISLESEQDTWRVKAKVSLLQTDFGIKPFKAALGLFKLKDVVEITFDLRLQKG